MKTMWRARDGRDKVPVEVECASTHWGELDASGAEIRNEHFLSEKEAWDHLRANVEAGIKLAARVVKEAREQMRRSEKSAARSVVELTGFWREFEERENNGRPLV